LPYVVLLSALSNSTSLAGYGGSLCFDRETSTVNFALDQVAGMGDALAHLHTLEIFWQHGFTTFFLGKNKKKCAKMWGAFFPVSGVHSSLEHYLEIELVKFILLFRGLCLMFCYSAD